MPTPTRSVRTLTPLESTRDLAAAFALALPEDVAFSHTTAARLWSSTLWWRDPATSGCQDLLVRFLDRETFRGRRLAREALRLIRPRVWSPMESYARVAMVSAQLPEPRLNLTVESERGPRRLAIGDFVWRHRAYRHKVVGEYNGPTHDRQLSREHDHTRRLDLEDEGWRVVEIYSRDVFEPQRRHRLMRRLAGWLGV
jgi:hypothetical protein